MELCFFNIYIRFMKSWSPQGVYDTDEKQEDKDILMARYSPRSPPAFETDMIWIALRATQGEKTSSGFHHLGISFSIDNNPKKTPTEWYK